MIVGKDLIEWRCMKQKLARNENTNPKNHQKNGNKLEYETHENEE